MKTNRTSCSEVREKLPLYVGGDLDRDVMEAVEGHLQLCSECARHLARASSARRVLVDSFRAQEFEVDQPGLWPGIRAKLLAEGRIRVDGADEVITAPRASRARWLWALAPLAAAAALLFFLQAGDELGTPGALPNRLGPSAIPAPEIAITPVSAPTGTLEKFFPDQSDSREVLVPVHYRQRGGGEMVEPAAPSLAGYNRSRMK